jgi:F0F1-type ATP synthase delta subunit
MKRQTLKQMVIESYSDGELDAKKINKIADLLTKKELRLYIKALKNWERENKIIIEVANKEGLDLDGFQEMFLDKKLVVTVDPSLLLGMRLYNNDDIFEMSLKNTLQKVTEHIEEQYD